MAGDVMSADYPDWVTSAAGRDLFAADGCVRGNIATTDYAVFVRAECEHVKIRGAMLIVAATSAEDAAAFVAKWHRIPQNHVIDARPAAECLSAAWLDETPYTGPTERT